MAVTANNSDSALPGEELVAEGLRDLSANRATEAALLLEIAAPRLRALGIAVEAHRDPGAESPEHRLYALLSAQPGAHSRYNALIARIASYARAAEHATSR